MTENNIAAEIELAIGLCADDFRRIKLAYDAGFRDALPNLGVAFELKQLFFFLDEHRGDGSLEAAFRGGLAWLSGAQRFKLRELARQARTVPDPDAAVVAISRKLLALARERHPEAKIGPEYITAWRERMAAWREQHHGAAPPPGNGAAAATDDDVDFDDDAAFDAEGKRRQPLEHAQQANGLHPPSLTPRAVYAPKQASAVPGPARRKAPAAVTGKRAVLLRKARRAELGAVYWHGEGRKQFKTRKAFLDALRQRLDGRDPNDPQDVPTDEISALLNLTIAMKFEIESAESAHKIAKRWKPEDYKFRMRTIAAIEPPEEVARYYSRKRNAERAAERKAERWKAKTMEAKMETQQQTAVTDTYALNTHAGIMALQKRNTAAQCAALLGAIGDGERTVAELMEAVRRHSRWRELADGDQMKFRRAVLDRLDMMRDEQHRIVDLPRRPGRRGRPERVVRRIERPTNEPERSS